MQPDKPATAFTEVTHIPYAETGYFSRIVVDYIEGSERLRSFYRYPASPEGIRQAIADRSQLPYDRHTLVQALKSQYQGMELSPKLRHNLDALLLPTTFTVTTAHQPNIFTGPLYFVYKILHAIRLADTLAGGEGGHHIVPVFFMGSEDADLDELGQVTVDGKKYTWQTRQTGAVGRMKVDKAFMTLLHDMAAQLEVLPHGREMIEHFAAAYREGTTIQQATLELLNRLFGHYGLVVLIPDAPALKQLFAPVLQKELQTLFSHQAVEKTATELSQHYKLQAGGREVNLFYLLGDKRERIEFNASKYTVPALRLEFTEEQILQELRDHPERFSPNVILRGLFQETILPNIAFIGGGAEIAYWLELGQVFEEAGLPMPVLLLRNSFLLLNGQQQESLADLGFTLTEFFKSPEQLLQALTLRESTHQLSLSEEIGALNSLYQELHETAVAIDPTLGAHVNALQAQAVKRLAGLEKKMLRAEKRKFETAYRKIAKLKNTAFPNGSLQERVENVSAFYARYGNGVLDKIYRQSPGLEQAFTVLSL